MKRTLTLAAASTAVLAVGSLAPSPAQATPSCVAQSIRTEHATYGTAWGHDLIAFLATHPELLQEFGFSSFGDLVRFAAAQPPESCPPDL
jgi:hypothetical protein